MVRKVRTKILANASAEFLKQLANEIESQYPIQMIEEPESGLVMIKMRESAQQYQFYLGEVFVTECKVMIGEVIGLGILQGAHKKKARCMAIIDAAFNAHLTLCSSLEEALSAEEDRQLHKQRELVASVLATKVDFDTLDEEIKS